MSTNDTIPTNDADLSPADVSLQTNVVTITDSSGTITGISYVAGSLMITPGQPSTPPPTIAQFDDSFTITLQAGRSNNSAVAAAFNAAAGGQFHEYAADGQSVYESTTPSSLNFYFAVQIDYDANGDVGSVVVYLGQGSYGSFIDPTNNWWIGGSAVSSIVVGSNNEGSIALADSVSLSGNQDTIIFSD